MVQRLEYDAGRECAVANDRDDGSIVTVHAAGEGDARAGRYARARVSGTNDVVRALLARGKSRESSRLTQGLEVVGATGDQLMRVGLVARVPDNRVTRALENTVQGQRQLDHAQIRGQMTAVGLNRIDDLRADFIGQRSHLVGGKPTQIGRLANAIENSVHNAPLATTGQFPMVPAL